MEKHNNILIVDDNPLIVDVLRSLFQSEEYNVKTSYNGEEAIDVLSSNEVDIIICDVMMPKMDGYMLQETLRQSSEFADIPFLFLTALGNDGEKRKGQESGADAYVVKPFDPDELLSIVKGKLKRAKRLHSVAVKQLDDFKSDIIRKVSHELRTPLVAVTTGSEFLLREKDKLDPSKANSLLESVWKGGQRLQGLVNNFISLQQVNTGLAERVYNKNSKKIKVSDFINEYIEYKKYELSSMLFDLTYLCNDTSLEIKACESQLKEMLEKIIANSIKFANDSKEIEIRVEGNLDDVRIIVRDYGQGFDSKSLEEMTSSFSQHNREYQEQQGGGLGLAIVESLSKINKAELHISNVEPAGSQVALIFPRA